MRSCGIDLRLRFGSGSTAAVKLWILEGLCSDAIDHSPECRAAIANADGLLGFAVCCAALQRVVRINVAVDEALAVMDRAHCTHKTNILAVISRIRRRTWFPRFFPLLPILRERNLKLLDFAEGCLYSVIPVGTGREHW